MISRRAGFGDKAGDGVTEAEGDVGDWLGVAVSRASPAGADGELVTGDGDADDVGIDITFGVVRPDDGGAMFVAASEPLSA